MISLLPLPVRGIESFEAWEARRTVLSRPHDQGVARNPGPKSRAFVSLSPLSGHEEASHIWSLVGHKGIIYFCSRDDEPDIVTKNEFFNDEIMSTRNDDRDAPFIAKPRRFHDKAK